MKIRDARQDDAGAACEALRASITELCVADHHDDPAILGRWLANKTPQNLEVWIADPRASLLVAVEDEAVLAVGSVKDDGEIMMNYVSPQARFRGVSTALLNAMETRARERGNAKCHLLSTETAHRFYLARGYRDNGVPEGKFGTHSSYPMTKKL